MSSNPTEKSGRDYWERAGELGYTRVMYRNAEVGEYLRRHLWMGAIRISREIGVPESGHVLDLGCGDGDFANLILAQHFARVSGLDSSHAGIHRARSNAAHGRVQFDVCDITHADFSKLPRYDAVFLMGLLHHVKPNASALVRGLRDLTNRVIILEPNGNNVVRKLFELTPAYRAAGEESFRTRELETIFTRAGFAQAVWRRLSLFPNFTPRFVLKALLPFEHFVETTPGLRALCTVNAWGFVADQQPRESISL